VEENIILKEELGQRISCLERITANGSYYIEYTLLLYQSILENA